MKEFYKLIFVLLLISTIGCKSTYTESEQLNQAIMAYDVNSIQYMLEHGANPNIIKNEYSDFPVYTAVTMFDVSNTPEKKKAAEEILKLIVKSGADINQRDISFGNTLLHYAKNIETVRLLVELGADVNAPDIKFGNTPLHTWIITFRSDLKMFQYLLEHGADVNKKNNSGKTVIDYANDKKLKYSKEENVKEILNVLKLYQLKQS